MAAPARTTSPSPPLSTTEAGVALLGLGSLLSLISTVIVLPSVGISAFVWLCSTSGFYYSWHRVVQVRLAGSRAPSLARVIRKPRLYTDVSWPTGFVVLHLSVALLFAVLYLGSLVGAVFETGAQFGVFTAVFVPLMAAVLTFILYRPVRDVEFESIS